MDSFPGAHPKGLTWKPHVSSLGLGLNVTRLDPERPSAALICVGWVFLVPGMGFFLPSSLFFLDLVFQFLPRVFSVPFGFFGSRRGCFRFPSKHGVSGSHLWVFSVPVFFWPFLFVMGTSASVPFLSWVFSVAPPRCCCCCCWSVLFWILWMVLVVLVPWEEATLKNKTAGGGLGGRPQRLPPRCIADNDDGGLCLEPVVVVVVVVLVKYVVHFPCMCHTYFTYILLTYFGSR